MDLASLRTSLTVRLAASFVGVLALALAGTGVYLDGALRAELEAGDERELADKLVTLRQHLSETGSLDSLATDPHRFLDVVVGHRDLSLALRDGSGRVLVSHGSRTAQALGAVGPPQQPAGPDEAGSGLRDSDGELRVASAWGRLGNGARTPVEIVLARDVSGRKEIVARYRTRILFGVVIAALSAGLLGALLIRAGVAPVHALARRAGAISASGLDERLPAEKVPLEVRELVDAFNITLQRLEDSFRRLSQFSADLAHDLRTPLGNIMGEAQVALSRPRTPKEYQAVLASNVEELERIQRMIDAMLFLARADNAQASLELQAFDAAAETDRVGEYYEGIAAEAGVALRRSGALTLHADASLFRRALANLVANAIAHTPPGGEVMIGLATRADGSAEIAVSNPGAGIPADLLPRVFDRFFRLDGSRLDSARGSGLGLAIVKSIMELHGGRVEVQSVPGAITTFRLVFRPPPATGPEGGSESAEALRPKAARWSAA